jgi:hypothetical protein
MTVQLAATFAHVTAFTKRVSNTLSCLWKLTILISLASRPYLAIEAICSPAPKARVFHVISRAILPAITLLAAVVQGSVAAATSEEGMWRASSRIRRRRNRR